MRYNFFGATASYNTELPVYFSASIHTLQILGMNGFPHRYTTQAHAEMEGSVKISSNGLPTLSTAPPAEFGGPGDEWSPETLLMAAVADCFVLSFRAIAQASQLSWQHLDCHVEGSLNQIEQAVRFTELIITAKLYINVDSDTRKVKRLLEKAKQTCFITNSLVAESRLEAEVVFTRIP